MAAPMTADEFRRWTDRPENIEKRWELVRGVPLEMPPWPASFDAVHLRIVAPLQDYVIRRGRGSVAFLNDGLITTRDPDTVRRPAVMVFLEPSPGDDFPPRFTTEVPALVVDLAAPGERPPRQFRRVEEYVMGFGVPLAWVVDPWCDEPLVTVYRPNTHPVVLDETDELTGNGVLPEFSCRVADLFALPGQPPPPPGKEPQ